MENSISRVKQAPKEENTRHAHSQLMSYGQQRKQQQATQKMFIHTLASMLIAKAIILGPLERMKIILQVNSLANFANPSDRPQGALDLSNKISINQGIFQFYRGNNAYIYKLVISHAVKFTLYETIFQQFSHRQEIPSFLASTGAATVTALLTTAMTYPLDLAHGRMSADMSKKATVVTISKNASPVSVKPPRLYSSVRDCLTKTQEQSGVVQSRKFLNMFRGIQSALLAQIPYSMILMGGFEVFSNLFDSNSVSFHKRDDKLFIYKFLTRFGASTLSLLIAQGICYPLDTVKRRMQLNGAQGYKNLYKSDLHCLQTVWKKEGVRGLYAGWSVNMVRCVPLTLIQYILFQNLRFISKEKKAGEQYGSNQKFKKE